MQMKNVRPEGKIGNDFFAYVAENTLFCSLQL